ncbi:hypothetical protein [Salinisphaera sp. LB1]|uniref:hypothetical protein n=1 Tax=Salinisphaera sp. LB1 TaxID=2183911 RepID=UPI000D705C49|nr:hypothetical protein [Salinisphaera sp. LB1]AWN16307.1 hypothetical protein SALB1_2109 [Salinisphaera sp. LB1]
MIIQDIASNLHQRVEWAGQAYRGVRRAWRDTQREAMAVVTHNSRSVANTEIGAAKNIYTSAQAAFRRARRDGLRKVAQRPGRYVPAGRKQMVAAYRATLKLLDRTRSELTEVASGGYQQITAQLAGSAEPSSEQGKRSPGAARKRPAKRSAEADAGAAKSRRTTRKPTSPPTAT